MGELRKEELWERGREIVLSAPSLYVDVDVEADGIAGHGSMLAIGVQSPTGESYYSEIKPQSDVYLEGHRAFCEAHGLGRERLLKEAPELTVVMQGLRKWLYELADTAQKPPILTAFNAGFDWAHVDLSFVRSGIFESPFGIAPFDLKSLALPLSEKWDFSKTKKSKLPSIIIPDGDFTHHALEDARYQQKLHFGMAALLGRTSYLGGHRTLIVARARLSCHYAGMTKSSGEYTVTLTSLFDPNEDVTFRVEPPIHFLTEEARLAFGKNVVSLMCRRADPNDMQDAYVELTHTSADGQATLGYAKVSALRYGTGEEVFRQALLVALNGEYPDLYSDGSIHKYR